MSGLDRKNEVRFVKKYISIILSILCIISLVGCGKNNTYEIEIIIPAGSTEAFVYSDEEVSTTGNKITISAGAGIVDTEIILKDVDETAETGYVAQYLTQGMPVEYDAEKGSWYKIGFGIQNDSDVDMTVSVKVEGVEVRFADSTDENESSPDKVIIEAKILEISEKSFLVEPVEGSWELNSSDQFTVPIEKMDSALEPQIGDIIEIVYNGEIMESYPAKLGKVYSIKVVQEIEHWDLIPMVMVNGKLYLDTGYESTVVRKCGVMDGEITSSVESWEKPTEDDQSNFGTGYGYQYGATEGTIEICMNEKWWIFAAEEAE